MVLDDAVEFGALVAEALLSRTESAWADKSLGFRVRGRGFRV